MKHYDVIVVGGGPAGGGVASPLARGGKKVAMVEAVAYGGVCPLSGCNPKKVLMSGAETMHMVARMTGSGVSGGITIDWPQLMRFKQSFVDPVPEGARKAYENQGIETWLGFAKFVNPFAVEVNGETLTAPNICICVGQESSPLPVPGGEGLPVSDDFLNLKNLPRRIIFIGGGFIAFEFAHIARMAGAEVVLLNRSDRVLRQFDPVLTQELVEASRAAGIDVRLEKPVQAVEHASGVFLVRCGEHGSDIIEADMVFNCTGRRAAVSRLDLNKAGVEYGPAGIAVNSRMQSVSSPHIYAIGDVADQGLALTPVATIQGRVAAANILHPDSVEVDYAGIPSVCFSLPSLARVGLLESEAQERGLEFKVRETDLADSFSWKRLNESFGRARVLIDERNDRILGAHILGHNAEELINLFALIVRQGIPVSKVRETVWAYPTCGYELKYML